MIAYRMKLIRRLGQCCIIYAVLKLENRLVLRFVSSCAFLFSPGRMEATDRAGLTSNLNPSSPWFCLLCITTALRTVNSNSLLTMGKWPQCACLCVFICLS